MKKKVCIKVENEQEFKALMKYYEEVKGWKWNSGNNPTMPPHGFFRYFPDVISFNDRMTHAINQSDDVNVIPFSHLAAIEGIEVEPEPIEFLTSNLTVTVFDYGVRILDQGRVVMVSFQELEKINEHVKEYQSKL